MRKNNESKYLLRVVCPAAVDGRRSMGKLEMTQMRGEPRNESMMYVVARR